MASPKGEGKGCLSMFLLWTFIVIIGMFTSDNFDDFPTLTLLIVFIIIGIIIEKAISSDAKKTPIPSKITEIEKKQGEEGLQYRSYLKNVTYISGHESYTKQCIGNIGIKKDEIVFYSDEIKTIDNWQTVVKSIKFTIKLDKIESIAYDLSEKITAGRLLLIGLASFAFKKKTYYLVINYKSKAGVLNQVVFETGSKKDQVFYNELNAQKNKYISENNVNDNSKKDISKELRELAKLKDEEILSEEEFQESKRKLLEQI